MSSPNLIIDIDLFKYILPYGIPRNSFIILAGEGGAGKSILAINIAGKVLASGEPVIYVSFDDDPVTVINQFSSFNIDARKYNEDKLFWIIDGFSYLISGETRRRDNIILSTVDPTDLNNTLYGIVKSIDQVGVRDKGLVIIDSLNEFLNYHEASRVVYAVKFLRSNISKYRNITLIALLHTSTEYYTDFLKSIEHLVDGILYTEVVVQHPLAGEIPVPLRQILVKKMKGVPHHTSWTLYMIDRTGIKPVIIRLKEEKKSG